MVNFEIKSYIELNFFNLSADGSQARLLYVKEFPDVFLNKAPNIVDWINLEVKEAVGDRANKIVVYHIVKLGSDLTKRDKIFSFKAVETKNKKTKLPEVTWHMVP
jgi:hypothetical protein